MHYLILYNCLWVNKFDQIDLLQIFFLKPLIMYVMSSLSGAFVGCAFNGSIVSTRDTENARFYGGPVKATDILLGSMARPPAASPLYKALSELMDRVGK